MSIKFQTGHQISHYRIIELIGTGGMSEVYLAEDQELKRNVALKLLLHRSEGESDLGFDYKLEAQTAASLNHPNIVTIYEIFEYQGWPVIAMEYVEGLLLSNLNKNDSLSIEQVLDIIVQLCNGISAAHELGIIHRDVKSDNIIVSPKGQVKIMDFGLALYKDRALAPESRSISGTYSYMSPEQARGEEVDFRSDIFSIGVVLYELITGQLPFKGEIAAAITYSIINENPEPVKTFGPEIPDELQRIIDRALEKDQTLRYQQVDEMIADLDMLRNNLYKYVSGSSATEDQPLPSIAVLPFRDMSPQKDQEYFGEGIAEDIINNLTKIEGMHVVARTSSFSLRDSMDDIKGIGRKLGVESILEGSVRKIDNRIRIVAQLINVNSGFHLWSERYDRVMKDMFEIQDEISISIAKRLEVKIEDEKKELHVRRHTENLEAYCQYLKGRYFWNARTGDSLKQAVHFFEEALKIDEEYALAYAGLSDVYRALPDYTSFPPNQALLKAREAATKAIEIDNSLSEAHASLAVVLNNMFDWNGAETEFRRAIELNPGNATARHWIALYFMYRAMFPEAIAEIRTAYSLDPLSLPINRDIGTVYYYAGQRAKAIEALQKTIELDPNFSLVHELLGRVYLKKGMHEKALEEFNKEKGFSRSWRPVLDAWIGITYMEMGLKQEAENILNELIKQSKKTYISPYSLSWIYFAFGDEELGFQWLETAYEEQDSWLCEMKVESVFDNVRQDRRFIALLKKIGLED